MNKLQDYYKIYPNLVLELIDYFGTLERVNERSLMEFCDKHRAANGDLLQPEVIDQMCQKLCAKNVMSVLKTGTIAALKNSYVTILNHDAWQQSRDHLRVYVNSIVYGFEYIYDVFKNIVVLFVWEKDDGEPSIGSGFLFRNGIVTAKHCIIDPKKLSIKGIYC